MRPTAGRRRNYKSPAIRAAEEAVERLQPPVLPEYLKRDDEDGPSGSEEEKDAKRLRSTFTTPRSGRGTDPDDYDRVVGISSVQTSEMGRCGDGSVTDVEGTDQGVVNDSEVSTQLASGLGTFRGVQLNAIDLSSTRDIFSRFNFELHVQKSHKIPGALFCVSSWMWFGGQQKFHIKSPHPLMQTNLLKSNVGGYNIS